MLALEPVIAPRKEKYLIQTNTMAYFANEQKSRFIEHHRDLLSNAVKDIVNPPPLHVNMKEEEKMEQGSIVIPQNDINVVEEVLYYQRERIVDNQEMSCKPFKSIRKHVGLMLRDVDGWRPFRCVQQCIGWMVY